MHDSILASIFRGSILSTFGCLWSLRRSHFEVAETDIGGNFAVG